MIPDPLVIHTIRGTPATGEQAAGLLLLSESGDVTVQITDEGVAIFAREGWTAQAAQFGFNLVDGAFTQGAWAAEASGSVARMAFFGEAPVARPSITGDLVQQQIDSIVSALVDLGLVTDGR